MAAFVPYPFHTAPSILSPSGISSYFSSSSPSFSSSSSSSSSMLSAFRISARASPMLRAVLAASTTVTSCRSFPSSSFSSPSSSILLSSSSSSQFCPAPSFTHRFISSSNQSPATITTALSASFTPSAAPSKDERDSNPLYQNPYFPRFDAVQAQHVVPAMTALLAQAETNLLALEARIEHSLTLSQGGKGLGYQELVPVLEHIEDSIGRPWGVVNHLKMVKDTKALREAVDVVQPKQVEFSMRLSQSEPLYKAFKAIKDNGDVWNSLSPSQRRVVDLQLRDAELAGVALHGDKKTRFNEIQQRLAKLSTQFSNNVLDATKAFSLRITDKKKLAGIPPSGLAFFAQAARTSDPHGPDQHATPENGPWLITLDAPSYLPVMQYAEDRDLRYTMYKEYLTRASEFNAPSTSVDKPEGVSLDNAPVIMEILKLRKEMAQILGFVDFARVSLARKMADFESVMNLMETLRMSSFDTAVKEHQELEVFAKEQCGFTGDKLMQWDVGFYAEKLQQNRFAFSAEDLRPYFSLPRVLDGLFALAQRLFDITVVPVTQDQAGNKIPVWDDQVQVFQILQDNEPIAYFYLDPYSRPQEKRGGAWMDEVASRSSTMAPDGSKFRLPIAHMVCNQSPPVDGQPSLMTLREVETLFHEFGHALQHMLTKENEGMVAGIRGVEWDAVEQPSQFMENWCYDKPTVDKMAVHYKTGEKIPQELFDKVIAAKNFRSAAMMLRQLQFSIVDLKLHSDYDPDGESSIFDVDLDVAKKCSVIPPQPFDRFLCSFSHIFAGGYSAGYYSYKYAEVLSADAFAAFEEVGLDDEQKVKETGRRFRETVLSMGGGKPAGEVFQLFRGRQPSPEALLKHNGLVAPANYS